MGIFSALKDALAKVQQNNRENAKEKTAPKEIFDRLRNKLEQVKEDTQNRKSSKRGRTRGSGKNRGDIFKEIREQFDQAAQENASAKKETTADKSILERIQQEMEAVEKNKRIKVEEKKTKSTNWGSPGSTPKTDDILGRILAGAHKEQQQNASQPEKAEDFGAIFDSIMGGGTKTKSSRSTKAKKVEPAKKKPTFGEIFDQLMEEEKKKPRASSSVTKNLPGPQVGGIALVDGNGGTLAIRTEPSMGAATLKERLPHNVNVQILDYSDRHKINLDGKETAWYLVDYNGMQGWVLESYLE